MSDDLDDVVRRAMKTLDDQVPSGYFDALPQRTLARLEGKDMQSTTGTNERDLEVSANVPPPVAPASGTTEDSGLHDIRSLAQSTKQRLSSKRVSTSPVRTDDDVLAASSASWKGVALPEPAKMVSLPSLDELPSKKEVLAHEKAAKKADKAAKAVATEMPPAMSMPSAPAVAATSQRFASFAQRKKSKAPLAIFGAVVAAAAGVAIYVATQQKSESKAPATVTMNDNAVAAQGAVAQAPAPTPTPAPVAAEAPKAPDVQPIDEAKDQAAAGSAAAPANVEEVAKVDPTPPKPGKHVAPKGKPSGKDKVESVKKEQTETPPPVEKKPADDKKVESKKGSGKGEEGEPSFDALLKEAGVDQNKKIAKPVLANKSLSGGDFKKGMDAVQGKAQGCYKGTQGTATFKVAVAPSGQVTSVTVTGVFAGKPEAACIVSAVKSASFPAWDGSQQSFTYSYLLAD